MGKVGVLLGLRIRLGFEQRKIEKVEGFGGMPISISACIGFDLAGKHNGYDIDKFGAHSHLSMVIGGKQDCR